MALTNKSTPGEIQTYWKRMGHGALSYHNAYRALHKIIGESHAEQVLQFALVSSYAQAILQTNSNAVVKLKVEEGRFQSLTVCTSFARQAFRHLLPIVCVDAAFSKTMHEYVLIIATGIDADSRV